jgi:hypothetical protein
MEMEVVKSAESLEDPEVSPYIAAVCSGNPCDQLFFQV